MKNKSVLLFRAAALATAFSFFSASLAAQNQGSMQEIGAFNGTNGSSPVSDLIQLPNGNFLGVTLPPERYPNTAGTIYELSAAGSIQVAYRLAADGSQGIYNGGSLYYGITQASDGKIYGLMSGTSTSEGIVYRFTLPSGPFEILHTFTIGDPTNGLGPTGKLVQAPDGYLYGVCSGGGQPDVFGYGYGTIFRVGLDGSFATLYAFSLSDSVGGNPNAGMILHPNGQLYGLTTAGTTGPGSLYLFDPQLPAPQPLVQGVSTALGALSPVVGSDQGLYVLGSGGTCDACSGQILRYGVDGSGPTTEFTFPQSAFSSLEGSLAQVSDGTFVGGAYPDGQEVFQVNIDTQAFTLYQMPQEFKNKPLVGNLTQGALGGLVGAVYQLNRSPALGGIYGLYASLPKPLPAISGFYPSTVQPGQSFAILGNSFVGVQSVSINGENLQFTVKASGAITAIAPQSQLSAPVVITSPAGSTTSTQLVTVQ